MAITDYKITDNEINTYNVKSAPDTLKANAQSNKNWFDRLGEFFISKYNSLLDFIQGDFINVDEVGAGLTYENSLEWKHALHKNVMIANYSGNITQITTGYRTIIANVTGLTTYDFMDCIMNINGTDYQCADAYESGDYATTTCNVEGVEVTITYSLSGGDITLTHTQNPLDTLYWNIQMFSTVADKIPAKSLPGNITNNAYTELDARADKWNGVALQKKGAYKSDFASGFISHNNTNAKFTLPWQPYIGSVIRIEGTVTSGSTSTYVRKALTISGTMSPVILVDGLAVEYQSSEDESLVFYKTATDQTVYTVEVTIYYEGEYRKETNYIPVMESVYDDNAYLMRAEDSIVRTAIDCAPSIVNSALQVGTTDINVGTVTGGNDVNATSSVALEGYTPIGIVGYELTGSGGTLRELEMRIISGHKCSYTISNASSTSATSVHLVVNVLYIENA